jgi:hypothetical protein
MSVTMYPQYNNLKKKKNRNGEYIPVAELLSSMHKALGSIQHQQNKYMDK